MSEPSMATEPLSAEDGARLRRIATDAARTWVGNNWPSMDDMRRDGIGAGLVEKPGKPDRAIRRFLDTFQPDFVLSLLDALGAERAERGDHDHHYDPRCPVCLTFARAERAKGIDVERLAMAIHATSGAIGKFQTEESYYREWAADIIVALAEPAEPVTPGFVGQGGEAE